jgi:hypothetical protein
MAFLSEVHNMNLARASGAALLALALIFGGIFYFVLGDREADTAPVDGAAITERAATAAGAKVTATQPPLKIEPK